MWTVAGGGLVDDIMTLLNGDGTTGSLQTIPRDMLDSGSVSFSLQLTNFLGGTSLTQATVTRTSNDATPTISIVGGSLVSIYRKDAIGIVASAVVPTCAGDVGKKLLYSWKVYSGVTHLSTHVSTSLDPKSFKLDSYSLDAGQEYGVMVTCTLDSDNTISSSTLVTVRVLESGVKAQISGGDTRTVSATAAYTIDASSSYDLDYPAGYNDARDIGLYTWNCIEKSPTYGAECGVTLPDSNILSFSQDGGDLFLNPGKSYQFELFVYRSSTSLTISDSAIVSVAVISTEIPEVTMGTINAKFNSESKVVLSATVSSVYVANATWKSDSVDLSTGNALTAVSKLLPAGVVSTMELSLIANSLTAGLTYTFSMEAFYPTTVGSAAPSEITITMNAPPSGGSLTVTPDTGYAMNTSFSLQTSGWVDDPDDYPLNYVLAYYTIDSTKQTALKNSGPQSYVLNAFIGQGIESDGYLATCFSSAMDIYGGTASTTIPITVSPVPDLSALSSVMESQLSSAFETSDVNLVSQVVGAVTSSLNSADCSSSPNCTVLNRFSCSATSNTCGSCISPNIGTPGDDNSACGDPNELRGVGEVCALNSNCVSNFCNTTSLLCDRTVAVCPTSGVDSLECGGIDISAGTGGECLYYDGYTNAAVDNCYAGDSSCYAKCSCVGDNYGADCSLTVDAFDQLRQMREQLCRSIYLTVAIQDLTADVVASRATAVSNIFLDIDQITDNALSNCTVAISETVINAIVIDPAYVAGDDEISSTVIAALSAVLAKGSDLPVELQVYVNDAITAWNAAKQAMLGVGEPESCSSTSNLNVCISNVYATDLESTQFTSAQRMHSIMYPLMSYN